eukprot:scaffold20.g7755.t1
MTFFLIAWMAVLLLARPFQEVSTTAISSWREAHVGGDTATHSHRRTAAGIHSYLSSSQQDDSALPWRREDYGGASQIVHPTAPPAEPLGPVLKALQGMAPLPAGEACLPPLDTQWPSLLGKAEARIYSQNEEDGALLGILLNIGVTSKRYAEFGAEDAAQCNTRILRERLGWTGLLMDSGHERLDINLRRAFVTPENINRLLTKYLLEEGQQLGAGGGAAAAAGAGGHDAKTLLDVMSIDLDYSDWWVWRAIDGAKFQPRVVIAEINAGIPPNVSATVDVDDAARWTGSNYFGASLKAMAELGRAKGYSLVYCDSVGVNAFFVRSDILRCQGVATPALEAAWRRPRYGGGAGHPPETNATRQWLFLGPGGEVLRREHVDRWPL